MKILLLGDASNYHRCLSIALAEHGHDVTVASHGSKWMGTDRDIDISRRKGVIGGALLWARLNTTLWHKLKGYDIVQITGTGFIEQKPRRIKRFFDRIRNHNGSIYLTALGTDTEYVRMCNMADSPLKYSEWSVNGRPTPFSSAHPERTSEWLTDEMCDLCHHIYQSVDGVATALYEYHLSCSMHIDQNRLQYTGIPVEIPREVSYPASNADGPVRILCASHKDRMSEKGADLLTAVVKEVVDNNPGKVCLDIVQNVPFDEFRARLDTAHIVVDQLYSYTPATTALMAMAKGKVTVSGGEEDFYRFIDEPTLRPIINPDPRDLGILKEKLSEVINDRNILARMAHESRIFVQKHNDADIVASRFEKLWERTLNRV